MTSLTATLTAKIALTDRITEFTLMAPDGTALPAYSAGAHVTVDLGQAGTRAYSLIHFAPDEQGDTYRIAVQREDAGEGGSIAMHALQVGDRVNISVPKNDFPLNDDAPAVLLAGGIGITPMISMAADLQAEGQPFALHFTGRTAGAMAYGTDLKALCGAALHLYCDDANPVDLAALMATVGQAHLYICGPRGMIDAARAAATAAGIPDTHIHIELFDTDAPQDGDTAFEVEVASTGDVFTVAPGQSIIDALEAGGVDVMYDCQRGDCGICQCDVISGEPDHRDVVLSDAERAAGNVMQICVSRAKSPRLVLDI